MHYLPRENDFYLLKNKIHFHINGFALSLALKQRLRATGKWPMKAEAVYLSLKVGVPEQPQCLDLQMKGTGSD